MEPYSWIPFAIFLAKYYWFATGAILFYDYFLTLGDELQYIWRGQKSWVSFLFLINRYVPMIYAIWITIALNYPTYTAKVCDKVVIIEFVYLVFSTLVTQVFFVARLYALAGESRRVLIVFALLAFIQTTLGIVFEVLARNSREEAFRNWSCPCGLTHHLCIASFLFPTGTLLFCIPDSRSSFNIRVTYSLFSFAFDLVSFATLIRMSYLTCGPTSTWPTILKTIMRDSALYFLAVMGSHSLVLLYIIIVPGNLRYFSSVGISPLAQIMVSRLVLSLRKSADRTIDVTDFISEELAFSANPNFSPQFRARNKDEPLCFLESGTCDPSDAGDTMILSPLPPEHSSNVC